LKVSHSNTSFEFYYDPNNPYKYGCVSVPGSFQPPPGHVLIDCDLACRIEGVNGVEKNDEVRSANDERSPTGGMAGH
jgi:hypothetical protein